MHTIIETYVDVKGQHPTKTLFQNQTFTVKSHTIN